MIIKISKSKLSTLMYWAKVGASSERGQLYKKMYPNRRTPYSKIEGLRRDIQSQKLFNHLAEAIR